MNFFNAQQMTAMQQQAGSQQQANLYAQQQAYGQQSNSYGQQQPYPVAQSQGGTTISHSFSDGTMVGYDRLRREMILTGKVSSLHVCSIC